jgi:Family of unknown function (DUF5419)
MKKLSFEDWMVRVNKQIADRCGGLTSEDLPDWHYMDSYEAGESPSSAARQALRAAW